MSLIELGVRWLEAQGASWRPIDAALSRFVSERTGSEALGWLAGLLSQAEGEGHSAIDLEQLAREGCPLPAAECLQHPWVTRGDAMQPLVWRAPRLSSLRQYRLEHAIAEALRARLAAKPLDAAAQQPIAATLERLFQGQDPRATQSARAAVMAALGTRLFVLSGGPGTGKTTTMARLLACFCAHARALGYAEAPRLRLAAPTGKAAQRMREALQAALPQLAAALADGPDGAAALATLAGVEPTTLHRLLGYRPHDGRYAHNVDDPLIADLVVVDEASMIDLELMHALLQALPERARLVLIGDAEQLSPVGVGSVFADLIGLREHPAMRHSVAVLEHVWRSEGALREAWRCLREEPGLFLDALRSGAYGEALQWEPVLDGGGLQNAVRRWFLRPEVRAARTAMQQAVHAPVPALAALRQAQLLCALRDGPAGAAGLNRLSAQIEGRIEGWHSGQPVILTANDPARGLANGDMGVVYQHERRWRVRMATGEAEGREFAVADLPALVPADALTIHKAQGSEFNQVALVLPLEASSRVLDRALLYTGATRARQGLCLIGSSAALERALQHQRRRVSQLPDLLGLD